MTTGKISGDPVATTPTGAVMAGVQSSANVGVPASIILARANHTGTQTLSTISDFGSNVAAWAAVPSSANLLAAITDETGTGALVFGTSPVLTTPTIGVATATSVNKVAITAPTTSATLTLIDGTTITGPAATGTLMSKTSTDTMTNKTFDTAGSGNAFSINSVAVTANTGTGAVARATSPTFVTPTLGAASATSLTTSAGTTAIAPINLTSGTNLTTAAAGAIEYDGTAIYATAVASSRQVVTAEQFVIATVAVSLSNSSTGAQNLFDTANDVLTVAASTTYFFEAFIFLGTGATSHTTAFGLGGTATFTNILYNANTVSAAAATISTTTSALEVLAATATVLNAASTAVVTKIALRGVMRINGAGTIIPQVTFSAGPTGTCQTNIDSFFRCWPVGSNTVAAVGNWA